MSRKNLFADLPTPASTSTAPPLARPLQGSPMSAVKRTVNDLKERNRRADEIEKSLTDGQSVIEIDTDIIDPSFVQDRMDSDVTGLRESIRDQGQQVPILVRLHPTDEGRYQVAFGHRRLRVLKELGLKAKSIVRELTDEQLVIAQGQENNEREDLTFIEKARFAARLKERFARETIITSLSVDKADLSRMLGLVESLPVDLINAIGPAPGVGRGGWQQLAELLEQAAFSKNASQFARTDEIQRLPSAERVKAVIAYLKPARVEKRAAGILSSPSGARLAEVKNNKARLELKVDKKVAPEFAIFLMEQVPTLFAEFQAKRQRNGE